MTESGLAAERWMVAGRVQGVGFRWFVLRGAQHLKLVGWVSNLADGRVEVVASGARDARDGLDDLLRRGPMMSRVDRVERISYPHDIGDAKSFEIR